MICGIWPLTSFRNAEFMVNELRVPVPEQFMERMRRADNAEKARDEGVAIAREMVARVRPMVQGVQLSAPFGRYQMAIDVAEAIEPAESQAASDRWQPTWSKSTQSDPQPEALERAAAAVRRGQVVAIPTDALYTLVADPFNLHAVTQVFKAKGREPHRSLPILVRDIMMAEELASELNTRFFILARRFCRDIETVVYGDRELSRRLQSFLLTTVTDESGTPRPAIELELGAGETADEEWVTALPSTFRDGLRHLNADYREALSEFPAAMELVITIHSTGGGPFAADAGRIKPRRFLPPT